MLLRLIQYALLFFLLGSVSTAAAFEVILDPPDPKPGDVLRIEVQGIDNPKRAYCEFRDKTYSFFPVGPGKMRALIGLTARLEPSSYQLTVVRKRFLLPSELKTLEVAVLGKKFTHQYITMPAKKTRLAGKPRAKTALKLIRGALNRQTRRQFWQGLFLRPAKGRRSSKYGHTRTINKNMSWDWHKGIDIAAPDGHPVLAPNGGRVVLADRFPVQGGTLILDHGQGVMSAFLHLSAFDVELGDQVWKGSRIATVGGGGFSTGSHLHWGVYIHGDAVDPEPLFHREF